MRQLLTFGLRDEWSMQSDVVCLRPQLVQCHQFDSDLATLVSSRHRVVADRLYATHSPIAEPSTHNTFRNVSNAKGVN